MTDFAGDGVRDGGVVGMRVFVGMGLEVGVGVGRGVGGCATCLGFQNCSNLESQRHNGRLVCLAQVSWHE